MFIEFQTFYMLLSVRVPNRCVLKKMKLTYYGPFGCVLEGPMKSNPNCPFLVGGVGNQYLSKVMNSRQHKNMLSNCFKQEALQKFLRGREQEHSGLKGSRSRCFSQRRERKMKKHCHDVCIIGMPLRIQKTKTKHPSSITLTKITT